MSFIGKFGFWCVAFLVGYAGLLGVLKWANVLPPTPLTGTECLDEKLALLRRTDLRDVNLVTVGSSVTWRNLDFREFERTVPVRAFNTAPCYLYTSQAAFLAERLLTWLPEVDTVLMVVAPRDMEMCAAPNEPFMDAHLFDDYVFRRREVPWIYGSNLRLIPFAQSVVARIAAGGGVRDGLVMDAYGSGFLRERQEWNPAPEIDPVCLDALSELERTVKRHGARLIVASFPLSPTWRERFDPDGTWVRSFEAEVAARLTAPDTIFVESGIFEGADADYADAVHFLRPAVPRYTRVLAERIVPAFL